MPLCVGNLLRTPDGKICILDFGMMTQVSISPQPSQALKIDTQERRNVMVSCSIDMSNSTVKREPNM